MNSAKQKEELTGLVVPPNPSAGYIKELVFISVAYGLIQAAMEVQNENIPSDGAITRQLGSKETKESRSLNQRINRRILALQKEIKNFLNEHHHLYNRFVPKKDKLMNTILAHTKNVQLDFLAVYVLNTRFMHKRNTPLHKNFEWIMKKENNLFEIVLMLEELECQDSSVSMVRFADLIKGMLDV